ncbi:hypothetical protein ABVK25_000383 [Lepraria finkii]|uniref:Uncharacterized protein n=1 Tax=Lepraria finkii TaxID=1340010 RepID=A0ABR4BPV2_9LECA
MALSLFRQLPRARMSESGNQLTHQLRKLPLKRSSQTGAGTRRAAVFVILPLERANTLTYQVPDKFNPPLLARSSSPMFGCVRRRFMHGTICKQSFWQLHKGNIVVGGMIGLCCAGTAANWYAEELLK